jgi:hypothetical protein
MVREGLNTALGAYYTRKVTSVTQSQEWIDPHRCRRHRYRSLASAACDRVAFSLPSSASSCAPCRRIIEPVPARRAHGSTLHAARKGWWRQPGGRGGGPHLFDRRSQRHAHRRYAHFSRLLEQRQGRLRAYRLRLPAPVDIHHLHILHAHLGVHLLRSIIDRRTY